MFFDEDYDNGLYDGKIECDKLISKYPHNEIKRAIIESLQVELVISGAMREIEMMDLLRERFPLLSPVHYFATPSSQTRELSFPFKEELSNGGLIKVFCERDDQFLKPTQKGVDFVEKLKRTDPA